MFDSKPLSLRAFLDLPLEIVYQILEHVDAEDGLSLLQVPSFRPLLIPSSSEAIKSLWRHWIRVQRAPACPAGVSMLRWADVLFGEHICDTCGNLNTPPEPRLLRRICRDCRLKSNLVVVLPHRLPQALSQVSKSGELGAPIKPCVRNIPSLCLSLRSVERPSITNRMDGYRPLPTGEIIKATYLESEWHDVRERLNRLGGPSADDYAARRRNLVAAVYECETRLCRWIAQYPLLRKPSWGAAQIRIRDAVLASRNPAPGFERREAELAWKEIDITPTLRHYNDSILRKLNSELDSVLKLNRRRCMDISQLSY